MSTLKGKREYTRPSDFDDGSYTDKRKAWGIAHFLQCDIEYYLGEVNSKNIVLPKHALDMILKHIHRELDDIKILLSDES